MDTSNEVARLVAHFPMPRIKPLTLFCQSLGRMCLYSTNLTPSQVLPLPLLQSRRGTTHHRIHMLTSDATALITTSCVLFYFTFSSFKVFEEPLSYLPPLHGDHRHSVCKRDNHTTPSTGTQATTPPSHPSLGPHTHRRHCPIRGNASYVFFFSFFFFSLFFPFFQSFSLPPFLGS